MTTQEIADKLFISVRTVDSHRQHILEKIGVRNVAGITRFALEQGIV
jgi:DNA-binding CsgD family transcriptional regulator